MIQIPKTRISAADEKKLFEKYHVLGKILSKELSDDDMKKTLKLRDKIRTKIVENHTGLVYKYAHKNKSKTYSGNLEFDDLVQFGMIGLLKSIDGYDYNSGFYFSTYASRNIELTIYRYINTSSRSIKIPEKEVTRFLKLMKENRGDLEKLGNLPHVDMVILNSMFGDSNSSNEEHLENVPTTTTPLEELSNKLVQIDIEKMVKSLPERDQTVVYHYFGVCGKKEMSVKELSEYMGYTKKTIYTLVESVCEKMKRRKHMLDGWEHYEES